MDAFSIVGLVGNIVQFVSFSHELITSVHELASGGGLQEMEQLKLLVHDVQRSNHEISVYFTSEPFQGELKPLQSITKECDKIAEELLEHLDHVKLNHSGWQRKLHAIRVAGRAMWTRNMMCNLAKRLLELENRLASWWIKTMIHRVHKSQDSDVQIILASINTLGDRLITRGMDVARLDDIKAALDQLWQSFEYQAERHHIELKSTVQELLTEQPLTAHLSVDTQELQCDCNLETAITLIQEYMAEGRKMSKAVEILRSLAFDSIHDRHDHIEQAHQRSCLWVYDPDRTNFAEWLGSGSGIYWINGLAGSGKSTLMKFITANDMTRRTLVGWAGDLKLITAGHYFWNAGTKMQKSHQGLLQTLLYQIIMAEPSLCDALCPDHCPETPWSMQELTTVFERLPAASQTTSMFCFFIDGLDEYHGPEEVILKVVKSLTAAPNIKICASSRPWPAFYAEWNSSIFTFKMQDFSRDDMTRYVKEYLESSEKFRSAAARDSRCLDLIPDISNKADGVWLWVYLVVRNILRDIRDGEPFQQWRNRLESYPQELDAYFRKMMERIDPFHRRQGSEIFLLALAACSPILMLGLRMLYDECIPQDATTKESYLLTEDELAQIYVAWQPRLQNRCRDLMRLSCNFSREHACERYEVEFLHRTVKDFLQEHYFSDLRALVSTNFNEAACLARLTLVTMEHVPFGRVMKQDSQRSLISMFFQYVRDAQNAEEVQQQPPHHFKLVDAFDSTMERLLARSGKLHAADHHVSWVQWVSGDDAVDFTHLTLQMRLRHYSLHRLQTRPERTHFQAVMYMRCALWLELRRMIFKMPPIDFKLVAGLVAQGIDPNIRLRPNVTAWTCLLEECVSCSSKWSNAQRADALSAVRVFLRHGAKANVLVWNRRLPDTLTDLFGRDAVTDLEDLVIESWVGRVMTAPSRALGAFHGYIGDHFKRR